MTATRAPEEFQKMKVPVFLPWVNAPTTRSRPSCACNSYAPGARRLGRRRRRRTSRRLLPAAQASTRSIAAHARLAFSLRPPGHDLADNSATEGEHTDH